MLSVDIGLMKLNIDQDQLEMFLNDRAEKFEQKFDSVIARLSTYTKSQFQFYKERSVHPLVGLDLIRPGEKITIGFDSGKSIDIKKEVDVNIELTIQKLEKWCDEIRRREKYLNMILDALNFIDEEERKLKEQFQEEFVNRQADILRFLGVTVI